MLLATTTVRVERPAQDADPYETTSTATLATGVPAHISAPSGADQRIGGDAEVVDAILLTDRTPVLVRTDIVVDETTGDTWQVTWTRVRIGLGLDHQKAGLVAVKGAAGG